MIAKFFTIMDNSTADMSHKDQMNSIVRFIEINAETFEVTSRDTFHCFEEMKACSADVIVKKTVSSFSSTVWIG